MALSRLLRAFFVTGVAALWIRTSNSQCACWIAAVLSNVAFRNPAFWVLSRFKSQTIKQASSGRLAADFFLSSGPIFGLWIARPRWGRLRRFRNSGGIWEATARTSYGTLTLLKNVAGVFGKVRLIVDRFSFLWFYLPAVIVVDISSPWSCTISKFLWIVACMASVIQQEIFAIHLNWIS